jgi:hypothetical protein
MTSVRTGKTDLDSLGRFWLRQQVWKRLGLTLEQFLELPWPEVEDYLVFIQLTNREEEAANRRANSGRR